MKAAPKAQVRLHPALPAKPREQQPLWRRRSPASSLNCTLPYASPGKPGAHRPIQSLQPTSSQAATLQSQSRRDYSGGARAPSGSSDWLGSGAERSRCARIFAMTAGSSMLAMILSFPPQRAQDWISTPNTRLSLWR